MKITFRNFEGEELIIDSKASWKRNRRVLIKVVKDWDPNEWEDEMPDYFTLREFLGTHLRCVVDEINRILYNDGIDPIYVENITYKRPYRNGRPTTVTLKNKWFQEAVRRFWAQKRGRL